MVLDSYVCELCIWQRQETVLHFFIRCNFAKACWTSIGINMLTHLPMLVLVKLLKRRLFFSRIRRRAAYLCINREKTVPYNSPPHSGLICEGLVLTKLWLIRHLYKELDHTHTH